jgi:hypothetical protein
MRGLATKLVVLLVLGGLFSYLVLPGVIENQLAGRLQVAFGAPTKPDVEISSSFPPKLLLGRIDRIRVKSLESSVFHNARADLRGVNVSVPSLLGGNPRIEARNCSLSIEVPAVSIDQNQECLSYLGLIPNPGDRLSIAPTDSEGRCRKL